MEVAEEDNAQISKRQAIQAIMRDTSLTSQERQKQIQKFMQSGGQTAETSATADASQAPREVASTSEPAETGDKVKPATSRQVQMKAIMQDKSLTSQEKQKRIKEIMSSPNSSSDQASAPVGQKPPPSAMVGATVSASTADPAARKIQRESMRSLPSSAAGVSNSSSDQASAPVGQKPPPSAMVGATASVSMADPAARKIQRESIRSVQSSAPGVSNSSSNQTSAPVGQNPPPSAMVGATASVSTADPAARKIQRESMRSLQSTRSFQSAAAPASTAEAAETPTPTTSRQAMMQAVMQDSSLTPQEKQQRIQEILAGGVGVGVAEESGTPSTASTAPAVVGASAATASVDPAARKIQRESMRSLPGTTTLAAAAAAVEDAETATSAPTASTDPAARKLRRESMRSLQSSRSGSSSSLTPAPSSEAPAAPTTSRQAMMQVVMQDSSLTPQEKQQRIQEIMGGGAGAGVAASDNVRELSSEQSLSTSLPPPRQDAAVESAPANEENGDMVHSQEDQPPIESSSAVVGEEEGGIQIQAYVAGQQHGTAVTAMDIYTQEELEEEEDNRKRRMLWLGVAVFCILIIGIVIAVLSLAPEDDPIDGGGDDGGVEFSEAPSPAPSSGPTPAAILELLAELEGRYPDQEMYDQAFSDLNSPQYQALLWASDEGNPDNLLGNDPRMISRYALATFYFATNGDEWARCSRDGTNCDSGEEWLLAEDECSWFAITCEDNTNDVTQISFLPTGAVNGNNVGGTMPFEMSLLPSLSRIAISGNILGGSIPDSWTGLTTLEAIVLANNKLTGLLPGFLISNNPNLRQIRLNDNQLSQLPESATSESLTLLDLANNNLMGSIPTGLKGLNALQTLDLRNNSLNDTIPEELFEMTSLRNLYLSENMFVGNISAGFETLINLRRLELNENSLSGAISDGLCSLKTTGDLQYLSADCEEVTCGCCDNCVSN